MIYEQNKLEVQLMIEIGINLIFLMEIVSLSSNYLLMNRQRKAQDN